MTGPRPSRHARPKALPPLGAARKKGRALNRAETGHTAGNVEGATATGTPPPHIRKASARAPRKSERCATSSRLPIGRATG